MSTLLNKQSWDYRDWKHMAKCVPDVSRKEAVNSGQKVHCSQFPQFHAGDCEIVSLDPDVLS